MMTSLLWPLFQLTLAVLAAQAPPAAPPGGRVREAREATEMLMQFAALPSASGDAEGAGQAATWVQERFRELGFDTRTLQAEGNPLVLAERKVASPSLTVLFYMHYDTQPTGPAEDWPATGGEPFHPRLLSGKWGDRGTESMQPASLDERSIGTARVYGRGIADDKAPIVMHLIALKRWLATPVAGRIHLKYLLDGEEEAGSPHIEASLGRNRQLLESDLLVLCDGPMDALGRRSVYLGARGDMHLRLRVRTGAQPAHSGNYGLLPNAAWRLSSLLSSMKQPDGRVTIDGFEEDVLAPTAAEKEILAEASRAETAIAEQLGVAAFEGDPAVPYYERLLFHPGFSINQLSAGRPGNQIPVTAEALMEVRLVARQDPKKVFEAIRRHVMARMPDVEIDYLDGVPAARMDPGELTISRALKAATRAEGGRVLVYPSLGGTLPLLDAFTAAGHKYVGLPLVNFDNNQHVGNENLEVSVLPDGIEYLVHLLDELAVMQGS